MAKRKEYPSEGTGIFGHLSSPTDSSPNYAQNGYRQKFSIYLKMSWEMFTNVQSCMLKKPSHKPQYFVIACTGEMGEILQYI